jgi:hypothetical protein
MINETARPLRNLIYLRHSNRREHLVDYEGDADRRPMTREECQLFFDHIDERVP